MAPSLAPDDSSNDGIPDIVLIGQGFFGNPTGGVARADGKHIGFVEFCPAVLRSLGLSPLYDLIVYVGSMCAKKEVIWSDTAWIVAMVKYAQPVRDRAVCPFPGDAVRFLLEIVRAFFYENHAITVAIYGARPVPTVAGLLNFCPEACGKWYRWSSHWSVASDQGSGAVLMLSTSALSRL